MIIENSEVLLKRDCWQGVSIFAFGGNAKNVNLSGLKYIANGLNITPDFPVGVSNSFAKDEARISVGRGALLIMLRYDS